MLKGYRDGKSCVRFSETQLYPPFCSVLWNTMSDSHSDSMGGDPLPSPSLSKELLWLVDQRTLISYYLRISFEPIMHHCTRIILFYLTVGISMTIIVSFLLWLGSRRGTPPPALRIWSDAPRAVISGIPSVTSNPEVSADAQHSTISLSLSGQVDVTSMVTLRSLWCHQVIVMSPWCQCEVTMWCHYVMSHVDIRTSLWGHFEVSVLS